jgi:hypothetical protein
MPLTTAAAHRKDLSPKRATMTHQHFRTIARILRDSRPAKSDDTALAHWRETVLVFALGLRATNPNFDAARFSAACNAED